MQSQPNLVGAQSFAFLLCVDPSQHWNNLNNCVTNTGEHNSDDPQFNFFDIGQPKQHPKGTKCTIVLS